MSHMNLGICIFCQHNIPSYGNILRNSRTAFHTQHSTSVALVHNAFFYQAGFLIMVNNDFVKSSQIIIAVQQHLGRLGKMSVIREGNGTSLGHIPYLSHFLALLPLGNSTNNLNVHHCIFFCTLLHSLYQGCCINNRVSIWHGGYTGIAASSCCPRTGTKIFLGFLAWLAKMYMHVNQAWADDPTLCLYNLSFLSSNIFCYLSDFAILYQHICNLIQLIGRVDYPATLYQNFHNALPPVNA